MDELYRIAQEVTDKVLGKGMYKKLNKFDPGKGETRQVSVIRVKRKIRRNP